MAVDIGQVIDIASNVVAIAATVAAVTPSPKDDGILSIIRQIIDVLAMNFGHAKNK